MVGSLYARGARSIASKARRESANDRVRQGFNWLQLKELSSTPFTGLTNAEVDWAAIGDESRGADLPAAPGRAARDEAA